jgi:hypothetical protein
MIGIRHTYNALLAGYEAVEITMDVRTRQSQLDAMSRAGRPATAIVDFPNWEIAAPICGLCRPDPDTGELTDEPLDKPQFPLTWEGVKDWPADWVHYVTGNRCLQDGLDDYQRHAHPNLKAG